MAGHTSSQCLALTHRNAAGLALKQVDRSEGYVTLFYALVALVWACLTSCYCTLYQSVTACYDSTAQQQLL